MIQTGTAGGGTAASLSADDNVFFNVNSTPVGNRTTAWYGSFTGRHHALTTLRVDDPGWNSVSSCNQTGLHLGAGPTTRGFSSTPARLAPPRSQLNNLAPTGVVADYVSGTTGDGEVRARIRCTRNSNFSSLQRRPAANQLRAIAAAGPPRRTLLSLPPLVSLAGHQKG